MSTVTPVEEDAPVDAAGGPPDPTVVERERHRRGNRRMAVTLVVVALILSGIGLLAASGSAHHAPVATTPSTRSPRQLAVAFLQRYVAPDGRVVRYDQGGDTVSEGQAYAMLLAVAAGDPHTFASVWKWEQTHLQQPDGLFAYHWADGKVASTTPATDADLDTAWALTLASQRFGVPAYRTEGAAVAAAILKNEVMYDHGHIVLVAGPWARTAPYTIDPSYFSPEAMAGLAAATGDHRWNQLAASSQSLVADLERRAPAGLPSDWGRLTLAGVATPEGAPSTTGSPSYGLDAQRVEIWYSADCTAAGRALPAGNWAVIRTLPGRGADLAYSLSGSVQNADTNGLGLVAAAGAAAAAGDTGQATSLLHEAAGADRGQNYYGDAWAALGAELLETTHLSSCPSAAPR